jgi:hypothetical protein
MTVPAALATLIAAESARAPAPAALALLTAVQQRFGSDLVAVLYYGSCRRSSTPDGLIDFYVLIDGTRAMRPLEALLLRLLEPNVYYLEVPYADGVARNKYTVVTWDAFRRGTTPRWFHSYLWGRFSQPTSVLWTRDPDIASAVQVALAEAPITFIRKVLPLLPDRFSAETLWLTGLATSYRTELRSERPDKLRRLYQDEAQHLDQAAAACAELLGYACESACEAADATPYRNPLGPGARRRGRLGWRVRMVSGTLLSFLRIVKSAATFEGALDYAAWKLSRQSGRSISIPAQVRAHPWRHAPGFFWRLYREGVFR